MTAGSGGHSPVRELEAVFDLEYLLAPIHTCFQVDMVWPVQLTRCLVFDIGIILERIMGAAHIALGACDFGLWNSHGFGLSLTLKFPATICVIATVVAPTNATPHEGGCLGESQASVNPNRPSITPPSRACMWLFPLFHIFVKQNVLF